MRATSPPPRDQPLTHGVWNQIHIRFSHLPCRPSHTATRPIQSALRLVNAVHGNLRRREKFERLALPGRFALHFALPLPPSTPYLLRILLQVYPHTIHPPFTCGEKQVSFGRRA